MKLLYCLICILALGHTTNSRNCSKTEFKCSINGECISLLKVQDGISDCFDGSDEECLPWQFDCQVGVPRCISQYKVNDGAIDCVSGFDEGCPPHNFVCSDRSSCVEFSKYQDGVAHCKDGSDEPCPAGYFLCNDHLKCINGEKFQNGVEDCRDGSDEECTVTQFECQCGSVRCIDGDKVKNGAKDCEDGSDEGETTDMRICRRKQYRKSKKINHHKGLLNSIAFAYCKANYGCRESLGEVCIMVGGASHCVCRKGTVRPQGTARCVPEQLLQQYINNIIGNCSLAQKDLLEYYGKNIVNSQKDSLIVSQRRNECDVKITSSCKGHGEVCIHGDHGYGTCECANNGTRIDGKCFVNECANPDLNDCDLNAACIDSDNSYECFCNEGYIDVSSTPTTRPGIKCVKLVDECSSKSTNECDREAECIDKPIGYTCHCKEGYHDVSKGGARNPGRKCKKLINECELGWTDCDPSANCTDLEDGYRCRCSSGYIDVSSDTVNKPGRICALCNDFFDTFSTLKRVSASLDCAGRNGTLCGHTNKLQCDGSECGCDSNSTISNDICFKHDSDPCQDNSLHDCDALAECTSEKPGYFQCRCPVNFVDLSNDERFPGRKCKKVEDECTLGTHDCDANADCMDTPQGFNCKCKPGWNDASANIKSAPGRKCERANLCTNIQCAIEAECSETQNGPVCECRSGYIDVSRQHGLTPGRVCRQVVNECESGAHNCSPLAACIDTADSFTCRCRDGYRDESENAKTYPGRACVKVLTPKPPECNVNDPMSCDASKKEVCVFTNGTYKCQCPAGRNRLPDGRCLVINECLDSRLNDCAPDAECIDQAEGYTCRCPSGFADVSHSGKSGRACRKRVNECANPLKFKVNCDSNSVCIDTDESYTCRCRSGYADISSSFNRLPGRSCIEAINECANDKLNDCSENAICEDAKEGYVCTCRSGYVDASPNITHYSGRVCHKPRDERPNEIQLRSQLDSCDPDSPICGHNEECADRRTRRLFVCECNQNAFRFSDGTCRLYSACTGDIDCDKNALCLNAFDTHKCQCRPGFVDVSPYPDTEPGRICRELVNECATGAHECSLHALCEDITDGYICTCLDGFVDTSSQLLHAPGRRCSNASDECADRILNTCDENADCIDTADSYTCQCYPGFIDVSSNANLPPGRVCTVQTTCPKQKTDLMFLIDGSGSIGSYVFKHEILRFLNEFIELFDVGLDQTRVGLIQYSDQIRHEFDLNQYVDLGSVHSAISEVQYLTGLTRTGSAIQHMVMEGFSQRRGARVDHDDVTRVAIVITDGRSQDNVTQPAISARNLNINIFAVGVTDHVLASELESIAGSPSRWFYVDRFKDLDTRLRSMIQKAACPSIEPKQPPRSGCNPRTQTGCNRALNEICIMNNGEYKCQCPKGFHRHTVSNVCGGDLCNPQIPTTCPHPEICTVTPFSNYRCTCPTNYTRDHQSGICLSAKNLRKPHILQSIDADCNNGGIKCLNNERCVKDPGLHRYICQCKPNYERNQQTGECGIPGSCDPKVPNSCDIRKKEKCLIHSSQNHYSCQCNPRERRHPVTGICLQDECLLGLHDCDRAARCIDTDDGYLCACQRGYLDHSSDPVNKPGRVCVAEKNECIDRTHNCSPNAICTDTFDGYICRCKPGYVDFSPNLHSFGGLICKEMINECHNSSSNSCHKDALCIDTVDSYKCVCKTGYIDIDELRNPGRRCQQEQRDDLCSSGKHDCDRNARCVNQKNKGYQCVCPSGYRDKSQNPAKPGRVCIPLIPECDNPALNDCDSPDHAICTDTDEGYICRCRRGYLDISPNLIEKPGRLCKLMDDECSKGTSDCSADGGICEDTPDSYTCRCAINYLDVSFDRQNHPGRKCKRLIDECSTGQNDCSPEAICTDTEDSYVCACPIGFIDVSPDTVHLPGRRCLLRINECKEGKHDCSPNADCIDNAESYSCKCRDDFVDASPDVKNNSGRICRPLLIDECRLGKHDCHENAICQDLQQSYTCHCKPSFIDQSPNPALKPGRLCSPRPTPPPDECRLDSSSSCKLNLNEVCRIINGVPKCTCPINYARNEKTKACTVINECEFPYLINCHPNAKCIDEADTYRCQCQDGFKDISSPGQAGQICQPYVNECQFPHLNDCHHDADCIDKEDSYDCKCHEGFKDKLPSRSGRLCKKLINECEKTGLNSCDKNAKCIDLEEGYRCECKHNYLDVSPSPTLRGRACKAIINECADPKLNDCDRMATCTDTTDSYKCECPQDSKDISPNPAFSGRVCLIFENECLTRKDDCDPNAICRDNEQSFTCECAQGFSDRSPNRLNRPGRVCIQLIDECTTKRHTCSAQADCRDLVEGYTCECKNGYIDRSPNLLTQPGRVCGTPEVCPTNHECSSAAVCEPLGGGNYECTCVQGYVDQSPAGQTGRICVRNTACRDSKLNNCSRNAICYDEARGYRCECARGFVDRSPEPAYSGRVCEAPTPPKQPPRQPCQDPSLNDCHPAGTCRATGSQSYTCECLRGYTDRSTDIEKKPGRICVLTQPICLDNSQNDCHPAAICRETTDADKYTCRCRHGYIDQSVDKINRPGRLCAEQINECLDRSLNDCDPLAVCEDLDDGYTCRCPINAEDRSKNPKKPGRKCFVRVNECRNPALNNCSRFADCMDHNEGYSCKCRDGYHDDNLSHPGTVCNYIINECESANLNDCDRHATCIDEAGGYSCKCKEPHRDESPTGQPGRICRLNECLEQSINNCDQNAVCKDLDDGFICHCKQGFYDESPNSHEPGRVCIAFQQEIVRKILPQDAPKLDGTPCGRDGICLTERNEVCVSGITCACRPGEARNTPNERCQAVDRTTLLLRVMSRDSRPLTYSSELGNSDSAPYAEMTHLFSNDMGRSIGGTSYATRYVTTDVNYITHPKTFNSSWPNGLLLNFSVATVPSSSPIDQCDMWNQLMQSLQRTNGAIGGGGLRVASDVHLLHPCRQEEIFGEICGQTFCKDELGEVCIADSLCGCKLGEKRASKGEICRAVESWNIALWVVRSDSVPLRFNRTFANPFEKINKNYVERFETGVTRCYPQTPLRSSFVSAEVIEIVDPKVVNATWDHGIIFNCTVHFRKGAVRVPSDVYRMLVNYIISLNNYEVGDSGLFLNAYQSDPFKACFKNNCHPKATCIDLGPNAYRCECASGYRDLNPSDPGRRCLPNFGYNECERKEDNECSENARCIDQENLYKCECLPSFADASPPDAIPGTVCVLDYCSDVSFCPTNTTCANEEQQAVCQCKPGFIDLRRSDRRAQILGAEVLCMQLRDIDECSLGLTNCSGVAECTDKPLGYECTCPEGYIDGNPDEPGRVCGALLCDLCNSHGDCVHNTITNNITCICSGGWSGEFCDVAPSNASLILLIILAILFLLLTLCCLLYLCTKCVCFKQHSAWNREPFTYRKGLWPWSTLEASSSSESGADFSGMSAAGHEYYPEIGIPRAKLKTNHGHLESQPGQASMIVSRLKNYLEEGLRIPRAHLDHSRDEFDSASQSSSEYTIREEIERRVITDITKKETRKTITKADVHDAVAEFYVYPPGDLSTESNSSQMACRSGIASSLIGNDERERGESIAEFSVGKTDRDMGGLAMRDSGNAQFSADRDLESLSTESNIESDVYDKRTLVKRDCNYKPQIGGGFEHYRTEFTTSITSKETKKL